MAKNCFLLFLCVSFILASRFSLLCDANDENGKLHIAYMGSLPSGAYSPTSHHLGMLQRVIGNDASNCLIRSYKRSFNGFAAMLTNRQREQLANMEGVISVFPSKTMQLQTTRSWDFMGLQESSKRNKTVESEIIIGVIDTGIWPESDSFKDDGFGPIPKKWKGSCAGGSNFTCNNKIIGARYYERSSVGGSISARDNIGHGSHTASIAAGNKVADVSFYGIAKGVARGGAPSARIAVYSVCQNGCQDADTLAAFDDAIADGVDLITISIGYSHPIDFKEDAIAIGSFHAMEKGILTVHSGGNTGPTRGTITSVAPWVLSVAASSTDRRVIDKVSLGNGLTLEGKSVNGFKSNGTMIPLVHGRFASYPNCSSLEAEKGSLRCLDPKLVKGKVILCAHDDGPCLWAYTLGAFGSIIRSEQFQSTVVAHPSLNIDPKAYTLALSYADSTTSPKVEILRSEAIIDTNAPMIADFSSRGPNAIVPEIMKPDISAPGVEILAAYSPIVPPSNGYGDKRSVKYNILSGTSMSCPHVAGIAAYVKSFHSDWSPAAIKSSIMTTAKTMKGGHKEFAYGSGHVDPLGAINPGLVFDLSKDDYVSLLCNIGYDTQTIRKMSDDGSACPSSAPQRSMVKDINYPSLATRVKPMQPFVVNFTRTVTNVGFANSTYKASVQNISGLNISVVPQVLSFGSLKEKLSFVTNVIGGKFPDESVLSSSILWTDGTHSVRCPVVVDVSVKA